MARSRRSALIRALAILCLVWVGADLGAHGFAPHDLPPITGGGGSPHFVQYEDAAGLALSADHCFSHGTFLGALPPPDLVGLAPSGPATLSRPIDAPECVRHPLDKPPQRRA